MHLPPEDGIEADLIASLTKENEDLNIQVALLEAKVERYKRAIEALMR